ncbi:hypothetical protein FB451DRAFT_1421624 [Mycena latifolia]|nr:hypothetical protein FB451DRAFT_1421624 [Mycena latifolia]
MPPWGRPLCCVLGWNRDDGMQLVRYVPFSNTKQQYVHSRLHWRGYWMQVEFGIGYVDGNGRTSGGSINIMLHSSDKAVLAQLIEATRLHYTHASISRVTIHTTDNYGSRSRRTGAHSRPSSSPFLSSEEWYTFTGKSSTIHALVSPSAATESCASCCDELNELNRLLSGAFESLEGETMLEAIHNCLIQLEEPQIDRDSGLPTQASGAFMKNSYVVQVIAMYLWFILILPLSSSLKAQLLFEARSKFIYIQVLPYTINPKYFKGVLRDVPARTSDFYSGSRTSRASPLPSATIHARYAREHPDSNWLKLFTQVMRTLSIHEPWSLLARIPLSESPRLHDIPTRRIPARNCPAPRGKCGHFTQRVFAQVRPHSAFQTLEDSRRSCAHCTASSVYPTSALSLLHCAAHAHSLALVLALSSSGCEVGEPS